MPWSTIVFAALLSASAPKPAVSPSPAPTADAAQASALTPSPMGAATRAAPKRPAAKASPIGPEIAGAARTTASSDPTASAPPAPQSPLPDTTPPAAGSPAVISAQAAGAPRKLPTLSVAVLDLADKGAGEQLTALLSETVLQEVSKLEATRITSMAALREALSLDRQRQLLGCEDSGCLTQIGGALGVDLMVSGSLGKVGDSWLVSLKLTSLKSGRVEQQASQRVIGSSGEALLEVAGPLVAKLFPDRPLKAGAERGIGEPLRERAHQLGSKSGRSWAWGTAAAAAAFLATGAGFGLAANSAETRYQSLAKQALTEPVAAADLADAKDAASQRALIANVLYGVGAATALSSVLLFAVSDSGDGGREVTAPTARIGLTRGGAFACVEGRF